MKRFIDVVFAGLGLLICSPIMLLIALIVALGSPGPVIFRQERVGQFGIGFNIYKFRTMRTDAIRGPKITVSGDARITRIGYWLRSTKLDELPQLVNVLRGDMSLIGPRPEVPTYVALWPLEEREIILSLKPGLSDPAAIAFRREAELLAEAEDPEQFYREEILPRKVALYVDYARNASLRGDLHLLWRTARAVVGD